MYCPLKQLWLVNSFTKCIYAPAKRSYPYLFVFSLFREAIFFKAKLLRKTCESCTKLFLTLIHEVCLHTEVSDVIYLCIFSVVGLPYL